MELLFKLIIGHAVADFALQSDAMAKGKNPNIPRDNIQSPNWRYWLLSHSLIHAGVVWLITGNVIYAFIELLCHYVIDMIKCDRHINSHEDQILHILCKILYCIIL